MYYDLVRMQLVAASIIIIIFVEYSSYKKLPLISTKCFAGILICSIVNLVLDFVTVFTIMNLESVPEFVNRILNVMYHLSFVGMIAMLYFYVDFFEKEYKKDNKNFVIMKLMPAVLGSIITLFCDINYYFDGSKLYTYGTVVYLCGIICAIYVVMILFCIFTRKYDIGRKIRISVGIGIWVILLVVQVTTHLLVSTLASAALILIIFTAIENPKLHIDDASKCFNERALKLMIDEIKQFNKPYYFVQLQIDNYDSLSARLGPKALNLIFYQITETRRLESPFTIFRRSADSFVVLARNNETPIEDKVKVINEFISKYNSVLIRYHMDIVTSDIIETYSDLERIFDYQNYTYSYLDKNTYRFVESSVKLSVERKDQIVTLLKDAIDNDGFDVYYQPIFDVKSNTFSSAEALIRLKDVTTLGYISPQEFIPLAEREGLIGVVGNVVFSNVCKFLNNTRVRELNLEYMDINLSAVQCTNPNLYSEILELIKANNIDPSSLNFEITESAILDGGNTVTTMMNELGKIGCKFSMDDFGTGYSNMSSLGKTNYETVKIDKSLVWPCFSGIEEEAKKARLVLKSVVELIGNLGIEVVAEGVESYEQLELLKAFGVGKMQGYFFAKPMIGRDFVEFLNKQDSLLKRK